MNTNEIYQALNEIEATTAATGINTELLLRVTEFIENHPDEFDMDEWGETYIDEPGFFRSVGIWLGIADEPTPPYTVGCVACHTVILGGGDPNGNRPAQAQRLLNLTDGQANRLFYADNWPEPYRTEMDENHNSEVNAWIAGQRFWHFIATNGEE